MFEGYITSEIIGKDQAQWVSIELEEFTDATTGMYYIVYDNETKDILFNGKDQGKTFRRLLHPERWFVHRSDSRNLMV